MLPSNWHKNCLTHSSRTPQHGTPCSCERMASACHHWCQRSPVQNKQERLNSPTERHEREELELPSGLGGNSRKARARPVRKSSFSCAVADTAQSLPQMENEHQPSALTMDFPAAAPVWVLPQYLE